MMELKTQTISSADVNPSGERMILLEWLVVVTSSPKVIFMEDKTLLSVNNLTLTLVQDYSVQVLSLLLLKMKKVVVVYLMTNLQLRQQNLL